MYDLVTLCNASYDLVTLCNAFHLNHVLLHFDARWLARASQLSYSFFLSFSFFPHRYYALVDKFKRIKICQKFKKEKVAKNLKKKRREVIQIKWAFNVKSQTNDANEMKVFY